MTIRRRSGRKCGAVLLAGLLTMGSSGCSTWDDPGYVYASGVATGVMTGLISVSVEVIGQAIGDIFFPGQQGENGSGSNGDTSTG